MEPNLSWVAVSCLPRHLPPCVVATSSIAPDANGGRSLCPVLYRSSHWGRSYFKSLHLRFHHSRVPALSHGGFGGNGGFGGSSNDGGDSGGERDEESSVGPSKSLLSWYFFIACSQLAQVPCCLLVKNFLLLPSTWTAFQVPVWTWKTTNLDKSMDKCIPNSDWGLNLSGSTKIPFFVSLLLE